MFENNQKKNETMNILKNTHSKRTHDFPITMNIKKLVKENKLEHFVFTNYSCTTCKKISNKHKTYHNVCKYCNIITRHEVSNIMMHNGHGNEYIMRFLLNITDIDIFKIIIDQIDYTKTITHFYNDQSVTDDVIIYMLRMKNYDCINVIFESYSDWPTKRNKELTINNNQTVFIINEFEKFMTTFDTIKNSKLNKCYNYNNILVALNDRKYTADTMSQIMWPDKYDNSINILLDNPYVITFSKNMFMKMLDNDLTYIISKDMINSDFFKMIDLLKDIYINEKNMKILLTQIIDSDKSENILPYLLAVKDSEYVFEMLKKMYHYKSNCLYDLQIANKNITEYCLINKYYNHMMHFMKIYNNNLDRLFKRLIKEIFYYDNSMRANILEFMIIIIENDHFVEKLISDVFQSQHLYFFCKNMINNDNSDGNDKRLIKLHRYDIGINGSFCKKDYMMIMKRNTKNYQIKQNIKLHNLSKKIDQHTIENTEKEINSQWNKTIVILGPNLINIIFDYSHDTFNDNIILKE